MIKDILLIILIIFMMIFSIGSYIVCLSECKKREKENKKAAAQGEVIANEITKANKTKADARTGDHSADIKYMSDKLHDYASK